jgi:predicted nucleic acid-binding protein
VNASVVVDASLALTWVLPEPFSAKAAALQQMWQRNGYGVLAPTLLGYECVNALYKRVLRGEMTGADATARLNTVLNRCVLLVMDSTLHARSLELAHQFARPATYDAHYLALAEREGCELWTGDERLYNAVRNQLGWVRWVGAYAPDEEQG